MKKVVSFLLIAMLVFSPLTVCARTPEYDASWAMMGDVNNDQKVNAIDARAVLRYSAKLDTAELDPYRADADGSGSINAVDARIILRVSAGLSNLTCGFDGKRIPCVVNTLKTGRYYIEASYDETGSGKGKLMSVKLAKSDDNIYFSSDALGDLDFSNPAGGSGSRFSECGMMMLKNDMYAIFGNSDVLFAIPVPPEQSGNLGIDAEGFIEMADLANAFIADDIGTPEKEIINDKECFVYSYFIDNAQFFLYVDSMGRILNIDSVNSKGENITLVTFDKVSGDNPTSYFDLEKYSILEIF